MRHAAALLLVALFLPARAQAQELGRLFFTPDQRAALDARRKARVPDKPAAVPQAEQPTTRVDGAVRRSGGRSTVWVNGEAIPENPRTEGAHLQTEGAKSGRVSLPAGESTQRYDLRVGETLDRNTGEVHDVVGGEVRVRSPGDPARPGPK
jgi:uncharacterized protein YfaP (DUF2135 family)